MSLAAIVIKILSAIYRIPYQNIVGDVGFYVYQQIYPIYGVAITLSTFGFPVIISKLISERVYSRHQVFKNAFFSLVLISSIAFIIFYFSAPVIANFMGDEQLQLPLRVISFIFLIIPLLSVFRGFFQGQEEMLPTAVSQVTEQLFRVCTILLFTYFLVANNYGPYAVGTGAALGSVVGGGIGFLVLILFYTRQQKDLSSLHNAKFSLPMIKTIIVQGVMICLSSLILISFQFVDSVTVLRLLIENGMGLDQAKVAKGVYDRGQPLIQMGTVITTSFSLIVVPLIAKVSSDGRHDLIEKYSTFAIKISFLIGAAASVGLAVIIEPTNIMLFKDNADSIVLAIMGLAIVFAALFLTTSAILQGLNRVHVTVVHVFIGFIVKAILNVILLPIYGTLGAAVSTVAASAVCACLNLYVLKRQNVLPTIVLGRGINVIFSLIAMAFMTYVWKEGSEAILSIESRLGNTFVALSSVAVGASIFSIYLISAKLFTEEELEYIPKVRRLAVVLQRRI